MDRLKENGYVTVQELSERLGVSEVTIRKDLKLLESNKLLHRSHGSASRMSPIISDRHIDVKEKLFTEEKLRIAKAACRLLEPGDKIIIASGTTLFAFANEIDASENLTVITSSVKVSLTLCYYPQIEIIQLGGIMRKNSVSVIGHYSGNILGSISCDKLFLGVDGIDFDHGMTTSEMNEARLNQQMIDAAQRVIVLADSSKFGKRGFFKICDVAKIQHIITDTGAPPHAVEMMQDRGIEVTLV